MYLFNNQNEPITVQQFGHLFHQELQVEEVFECIFSYSFLYKREDGLVVELSLLYPETHAYILVYKDRRVVAQAFYTEANYVKILDQKNKIIEIVSPEEGFVPLESKAVAVISLAGTPIFQFSDKL